MWHWYILVGVFFLLWVIAGLLDLYLIKLNIIREKLTDFWAWLGTKEIKDTPTKMAKNVIQIYNKIFGENYFSFKSILITFPISFLLTLNAVLWGRSIEVRHHLGLIDSFRNTLIGLIPNQGFYNSQFLFPVNFVFDFLTLIVTIFIIKLIYENKNNLIRIALVITDLIIAGAFSITTMAVIKANSLVVREDIPASFSILNNAANLPKPSV